MAVVKTEAAHVKLQNGKAKQMPHCIPELCCNYCIMLSVTVANKTLHIQSWLSIAKIYDILYIITQSYLFIQKQKNLDLTPLKKFWKVILNMGLFLVLHNNECNIIKLEETGLCLSM